MAVMFFKLFTLCLPFFCLLLTWASSTPPPPPPPRSAISTLHSSGYSRFATKLMSASTTNSFNATGTILAPPDFAFSFAAAKFHNHRHRFPPRPSTSLLLYHTLDQPLTWHDLHSRAHGDELRTLFERHCIFVSKTANGDLSFSGSRNSIAGVKIRHPNLYVDDHLTVHGVDGVLDPSSASKCSVPNPTVEIKLQIDRNLLDLAARALRKSGFYVVATAMTIKSSDLMNLNGVTVFAPSDEKLFSFPDGFTYDFIQHVVPKRLRFADIARLPAKTVIETIDPNKTLVIDSVDGYITINGAKIDSTEIYLNRWIVVISVSRTLVDGGEYSQKNQAAGGDGVPSTAPTYSNPRVEDYGISVPSVAPSSSGYYDDATGNSQIQGSGNNGVASTAPIYATTRLEDYGISFVSVAPSFSGGSGDGGDINQIQGAGSDGTPSTAPVYSKGLNDYGIAVPSDSPNSPGGSDYGGSDGVRYAAPIYSATGLEDYRIAVPSVAPSFSSYSSDRAPSTAPIYPTRGLENYGIAAPSVAWSFSGNSEVSSPTSESPAIEGYLAMVQAGVPPPASDFSDESEIVARSSSPAESYVADFSPAI